MVSRKNLAIGAGVVALGIGLGLGVMNEMENERTRLSIQESFTDATYNNEAHFAVDVFADAGKSYRQMVADEAQEEGFALCGAFPWPAPPKGEASALMFFVLAATQNSPGQNVAAFGFVDSSDFKDMNSPSGEGRIYGKPCPVAPQR